jgi:hypothetical protein
MRRICAFYADGTHESNKRKWEQDLEQVLTQLEAFPRRKVKLGRKLSSIIAQYTAYSEALKLDWPALGQSIVFAKYQTQIQEHAARMLERDRSYRERERKATRPTPEEAEEMLARWRAGERVDIRFTTALRIRGNYISTSLGASVPIEDAEEIWPLLKRARKLRRNVLLKDHLLGGYRASHLSAEGELVVGCHTIPWSEIEGVARTLGWIEAPILEEEAA